MQCRVDPMFSSVLWNANTHLKYFIPIFMNLKHIQIINTVKEISQFSLHAIALLALLLKRASLCNR